METYSRTFWLMASRCTSFPTGSGFHGSGVFVTDGMATSVTVTVEGKPICVTGAAAKAILWIVKHMAFINSEDAAGVIHLNLNGSNQDAKGKYDVFPLTN